MLGAQALRTKQKAEQKEKEKRHRERLQSVQLEREKMHRIAREDMNELAHETSLLHLRDQSEPRRGSGSIKNHRSPSRSEDLSLPPPHRHRHSIHNVNLLQPVNPKRRSLRLNDGPQRSTSSDYCRVVEKKESGNRFMRWLGFSSSSNADKEKEKRRMSTY